MLGYHDIGKILFVRNLFIVRNFNYKVQIEDLIFVIGWGLVFTRNHSFLVQYDLSLFLKFYNTIVSNDF